MAVALGVDDLAVAQGLRMRRELILDVRILGRQNQLFSLQHAVDEAGHQRLRVLLHA